MKDEVIALSSLLHTRSPSALQREVKPAVSQAADLVLGSPKRTTVLCVDNSSPRANALKALLEERGYQVWMAKDLADARKLEANTSGTRLLNLHKKRLVRRTEEMRSDGTVWVYELL
jgi:PleD family two-component response regulator